MVKKDWSKAKIYSITCRNTNKMFIGRTTLTLEEEKERVLNVLSKYIDGSASYKYPEDEYMYLHFAIQGKNAMKFEILEELNLKSSQASITPLYNWRVKLDTRNTGLDIYDAPEEDDPNSRTAHLRRELKALRTKPVVTPIVAPVVNQVAKPVVAKPVVAPVVTPVIKPRVTKPKTKPVITPIITPKPTKTTKPKTTNTVVAFIATKPRSKAGTDFNALLQKITVKASLQGLL